MGEKKRIFVGLVLGSLALLLLLLAGGLYLLFFRTSSLARWLLAGVTGAAGLFLLLGFVGVVALVLALWRQKTSPTLENIIGLVINWMFPLALEVGKVFGLDQEVIKNSFITVHNQLVGIKEVRVNPADIMILAPHCLQRSTCLHKITTDVNNCRRCGKCAIDALRGLVDTYGVQLAVATGGSLAREIIKKARPRAVVAIACERDLTSGIQDSQALPVLGVVNLRPNGPCFNTEVSLERVEAGIVSFLRGPDSLPAGETGKRNRFTNHTRKGII